MVLRTIAFDVIIEDSSNNNDGSTNESHSHSHSLLARDGFMVVERDGSVLWTKVGLRKYLDSVVGMMISSPSSLSYSSSSSSIAEIKRKSLIHSLPFHTYLLPDGFDDNKRVNTTSITSIATKVDNNTPKLISKDLDVVTTTNQSTAATVVTVLSPPYTTTTITNVKNANKGEGLNNNTFGTNNETPTKSVNATTTTSVTTPKTLKNLNNIPVAFSQTVTVTSKTTATTVETPTPTPTPTVTVTTTNTTTSSRANTTKMESKKVTAYLLRPYIHSTLAQRLITRPFLSHVEKLHITYQLLIGLGSLHNANVIHGGICSENIGVTGWNGIVYLDLLGSFGVVGAGGGQVKNDIINDDSCNGDRMVNNSSSSRKKRKRGACCRPVQIPCDDPTIWIEHFQEIDPPDDDEAGNVARVAMGGNMVNTSGISIGIGMGMGGSGGGDNVAERIGSGVNETVASGRTSLPLMAATKMMSFATTIGNSEGGGRCYVAPERFYHHHFLINATGDDDQIPVAAASELTPAMDIFSLGCVIVELMLDGERALCLADYCKCWRIANERSCCDRSSGNDQDNEFLGCNEGISSASSVSSFTSYSSSWKDIFEQNLTLMLSSRLDRIGPPPLRSCLRSMLNPDPVMRLSATQYLEMLKTSNSNAPGGGTIPSCVEDVLYPLVRRTLGGSVHSPDSLVALAACRYGEVVKRCLGLVDVEGEAHMFRMLGSTIVKFEKVMVEDDRLFEGKNRLGIEKSEVGVCNGNSAIGNKQTIGIGIDSIAPITESSLISPHKPVSEDIVLSDMEKIILQVESQMSCILNSCPEVVSSDEPLGYQYRQRESSLTVSEVKIETKTNDHKEFYSIDSVTEDKTVTTRGNKYIITAASRSSLIIYVQFVLSVVRSVHRPSSRLVALHIISRLNVHLSQLHNDDSSDDDIDYGDGDDIRLQRLVPVLLSFVSDVSLSLFKAYLHLYSFVK